MGDVDVDVAALLSDDLALGMQPLRGTGGNQPPLPVALFELRESAMASHPDGSIQELQVEAIIQAGFSRWRSVVTFEELPDWAVRQTPAGLELWEGDGIWARGTTALSAQWLAAAHDRGKVLAVYGPHLGVRQPAYSSRWTAEERAEDLRTGLRAGWGRRDAG